MSNQEKQKPIDDDTSHHHFNSCFGSCPSPKALSVRSSFTYIHSQKGHHQQCQQTGADPHRRTHQCIGIAGKLGLTRIGKARITQKDATHRSLFFFLSIK